MQRTLILDAGEMAVVSDADTSFCLVCDSHLEVASALNIFYTSLPRNGELLASFVLRVLRPAATDLRSSYVCSRCYELFRMLEQAQWTASNIKCEILKVYRGRDDLMKVQEAKDILPNTERSQNSVYIGDTTREAIKTLDENFVDIRELRLDEENIKNITSNNEILVENQTTIIPDFNSLNMEMNNSNGTSMIDEKRDIDSIVMVKTINDYSDNINHVKTEAINEKLAIEDSMENVKNLGVTETNELAKNLKISFNERTNLTNINDANTIYDLQCKICMKTFETTKNLDSHFIEHSRHYECRNCDERFSSLESANVHAMEIHAGVKNCIKLANAESENEMVDFTNETFEFHDEFTERNLMISGSEETTKIKEAAIGSWKSGRISKYSQKPLKYPCSNCGKKWRTLAELKTHVKSHSNLRPYMCEKCGQAYKHKHALEIHVGMHNGISPFKCNVCNKCFTQKGALMRHLPMHTGDPPYQCELCGKRFVHHTSYNMHALSHTGKKLYQCHVCDVSLLSTSHLKRHMRVHTGEKSFKCSLCGKSFAERYNLFAHQKIHDPAEIMAKAAKKAMFKCDRCDEHFDRKQKLDDHARQHEESITLDESTNERKWLGHTIDVEAQGDVKLSKTSENIIEQTWQGLDYAKLSQIGHRTNQNGNEIPQISHESMTMLVSQENYTRDLALVVQSSNLENERSQI